MKKIVSLAIALGCSERAKQDPADAVSATDDGLCETNFQYQTDSQPDGVQLAGDFNGWDTDEHPMVESVDGQ